MLNTPILTKVMTIKMRFAPVTLAFGLFAATWCTCLAASGPNVLILFTDDQGTLDAGCYGSADLHTPNMDKLAATGVRFTQAYAHTVCCPSRAMLLTGRHPQRSGIGFWAQGQMNTPKGRNLALDEMTLAEVLQQAGYRTALYGKWHLGAHRDHGPKKQGFDEFFGIRDGFIDNYNHYFLHNLGYHDLYEGTEEVHAKGEYFPEMMVKRCLKFIDQVHDQPFFLYAPFNIPHYPEQALKRFEDHYAEMKEPARRSYGAMISTTDYFMGQILDRLRSHDVLDNTIVVFMSDNGHSEETEYRIKRKEHTSGYPEGHFYGASGGGNTGKWIGSKGQFLEGGIRVPAIISYPAKLPQGVVRNQIITAMDWYPTILELCGIETPEHAPKIDGHSLVSICQSANAKSGYNGELHFQWGDKWAVRKGDWKLIGADGKPKVTLHRLVGEDPEAVDHASDKPQVVARLKRLHDAWAQDVAPQ